MKSVNPMLQVHWSRKGLPILPSKNLAPESTLVPHHSQTTCCCKCSVVMTTYIGRKQYFDTLHEHVGKANAGPIIVVAESGLGKVCNRVWMSVVWM